MTKYTGILKYNKQVAASTVILPGTDQKIWMYLSRTHKDLIVNMNAADGFQTYYENKA
jgi:hypothetical protein